MRRSLALLVALSIFGAFSTSALAAGRQYQLAENDWLNNWLAGPLPGRDRAQSLQVAVAPQPMPASAGAIDYRALNNWLSGPLPGQDAPQQAAAPALAPAPAASPKPPVTVIIPEMKQDKWLNDWLSGQLPGDNAAQPFVAQPLAAPQPTNLAPATLNIGGVVEGVDIDFNDPLEPMNRFFFGFNEGLQDYFLHPLAEAYNMLPEFIRGSVSSFLLNLRSPIVLANDILQFEPMRALKTGGRILINSTVGVGGLIDVADQFGIEAHNEDFGQTLATWGVGEGVYMVLPIIGPTNPRDVIGKYGVDSLLDPFSYYLNGTDNSQWIWVRAVAEGFDDYAGMVGELDNVKATSMDYYASVRSMYRQKRQVEILNGVDPPLLEIPEYQGL